MRKYFILILCTLCIGALLFTAGCSEDTPAGTTTAAPTEPTINGAQVYADAIAPVESAKDVSVQTSIKQTMTVGTVTFKNDTTQTINYHTDEKGNFTASVSEKENYNGKTLHQEAQYIDGKIYVTIMDSPFVTNLSKQDFKARYTPVILLDPALYSTVTVAEDQSTILFSDATAVELWMAGEEAELISATGSVTLDAQGTLQSSTYTVSYRLGSATFDTTVTARICPPDTTPVEKPADTEDRVEVNQLDAVETILRVSSYIAGADHITANSYRNTVSAATGVLLTETNTVNTYGTGKDHMAKIEQSVSYVNYSSGDDFKEDVNIVFRDGTYTVTHNDEEPQVDPTVTVDSVRMYYQLLLVNDLINVALLDDCTVTDLDGITMYDFGLTEGAGQFLGYTICEELFDDGNLLNDLASDYKDIETSMYLSMDSYTGLPIAFGMKYEGCHTIRGNEYPLVQQIDLSFDLASMTSYEAITEKTSPDIMPEKKPTPLLYHVTGAAGQEMWLLGTIHVGDDRTGFLPQKLLDAFDASDALALEIDSAALEDRVKEDDALLEQLQDIYFYSGTDTTKDHIKDSALYEQALQKMKATGNYFYNTNYLQVTLWESSLAESYLRLGHQLTTEKGLESRLQKRAKEHDIPVWEVEDTMEHIRFQTEWSAELQEYVLRQTTEMSIADYCADSLALYELWCAGDEAALIAAINEEDNADLSADELALAEEYNETMMVKRNAQMLDKAKEYLESENVVFYAVGLAHLLSEDGLVNTLRDAGYTVELVTYE